MGTVPSPHTFAALEVATAANVNTVGSAASFLLSPPRCRVAISGDRSADGTGAAFTAATWQSIPFNAETFDVPQSGDTQMHNGTTNSSRITVQTAGTYMVGYSIIVDAGTTAQDIQTAVYKNGALWGAMDRRTCTGSEGMQGTDLIPCAAGDYIEVYVNWATTAGVVRGYTGASTFWVRWGSQ